MSFLNAYGAGVVPDIWYAFHLPEQMPAAGERSADYASSPSLMRPK